VVKDVLKGRQGQGADYEKPRSVREVREEWRISSNSFDSREQNKLVWFCRAQKLAYEVNAEIGALLRHLHRA